jgi:hypothetical protein
VLTSFCTGGILKGAEAGDVFFIPIGRSVWGEVNSVVRRVLPNITYSLTKQ